MPPVLAWSLRKRSSETVEYLHAIISVTDNIYGDGSSVKMKNIGKYPDPALVKMKKNCNSRLKFPGYEVIGCKGTLIAAQFKSW